MLFPISRDAILRLTRYACTFEAAALLVAAALALAYAAIARVPYREAFVLMAFVLFLLILFYAVLAGPGFFLSRPRLAPIGPAAGAQWRRWLTAPAVVRDREFFELVFYVGLAFLLIAIATGIDAVARALGG